MSLTLEEFFDYLLCWLMTYGLAFSIAVTKGPFGMFEGFREHVRFWNSDRDDHWMVDGVKCPICLSFWISAVLTLALGGGVTMWLSSFGFTCLVVSLSPD